MCDNKNLNQSKQETWVPFVVNVVFMTGVGSKWLCYGMVDGSLVMDVHMLVQLEEERRGLEQQVEMLAGQLSGERSTVRSLEEVLNQKRRTEWSSESSIKQLQVEKSQMQRKVSLPPFCQMVPYDFCCCGVLFFPN